MFKSREVKEPHNTNLFGSMPASILGSSVAPEDFLTDPFGSSNNGLMPILANMLGSMPVSILGSTAALVGSTIKQ